MVEMLDAYMKKKFGDVEYSAKLKGAKAFGVQYYEAIEVEAKI